MAESKFIIPEEFNKEIYHTLNDIDNILYFKWDLRTDTLKFTSPVEGSDYKLPQVAQPASTYFWGGEFIHPEDAESFGTFLDEMFWLNMCSNDYKFFSKKVRFLAKDEKNYLWAELRLVIYFGDEIPVIAFGCICNINVKQLWQMELQHSAEHDVLTGFLNKAATQKSIERYISELTPRDLPPALIMIDADGFKAINDSFGHLFGDGVLSDMSKAIRENFRQKDVFGRIGGDEFVVLFTEMPSQSVLEQRCTNLLKDLDRTYESNNVKLPFSVSIGVSLYPEHGNTYKELFKHADRALYESKSRGKNQYSIYRSSLVGRTFEVKSDRDPQHAEDIRQRAFEDNMLEFILNMIYETQNSDITISVCLGLFGKQFNLDRVAVDKFNHSTNKYTNAFEWISPNGMSLNCKADSSMIRHVDTRYKMIDSMYQPTAYGVMAICDDTLDRFPQHRPAIEALKLGSFVYCKISHGSEDVGCVGFECVNGRDFEKEELTKLSIFSVLLGNVLLDQHADNIAERVNRHLQNILDHMQEFIYVVDKDTYEPIFFNMTIRQTLSTTSTDQPCYKRFHNFDKPCEGCPISRLSKDGNEYIDVKLSNWGIETPARVYNIHWEDEQYRNLALIIQSSF